MATAIEFNHVGKQYRLGLVSTGTISHDLNRWWQTAILRREDPYLKIGSVNDRTQKADSDYVWALRDIDFKVEQGDVVGIIGKNGAGKSTLLKLLSKVTGPTVGTIRARGRIASLLEVGTGFHPEMTGRENIFMNGAIMGMTKQEIAAKLDEIVAFSGCEKYIDTPVKRYSSGMTVRLGFAVAAHLDPEILVVDEVLAVGDAEFQKKAVGKMQDVSRGEGRTVLFVSHNMASVRQLCNTGVLLENGMVKYKGDISSTINNYLLQNDDMLDHYIDTIQYHSNQILIEKVLCNGKCNGDIEISSLNNSIEFYFKGYAKDTLKIALEVRLYDMNEVLLGMFSPSHQTGSAQICNGEFELNYIMHLPQNITKGDFYLEIALTHPNVEYWLTFDKKITLHSQGIVGVTGQNFDYTGTGFLMLS